MRDKGLTLSEGWDGLHAVVYSFVAGWMSYIFVEGPTRRSKMANWKVFVLFAICSGALLGFAVFQLRFRFGRNADLASSNCCTRDPTQACTDHMDCIDLGFCVANGSIAGLVCGPFRDLKGYQEQKNFCSLFSTIYKKGPHIYPSKIGNISFPVRKPDWVLRFNFRFCRIMMIWKPILPFHHLNLARLVGAVWCASLERIHAHQLILVV